MKEHSNRDSNFELLRILSIISIIIHHFLIALGWVDYKEGTLKGGEFINAFAVTGVNCFILISGYYRINFKWKKLCYLSFLIISIVCIDWFLGFLFPGYFNSSYAIRTIIPFIKGSNWFITSYFALMFIAPMLNASIEQLEKRNEIKQVILFLTIPNLTAYFFNTNTINANGYCCMHLIYVYFLGAGLRLFHLPTGRKALIGYLSGSFMAFLIAYTYKSGYTAYAYNSPQILLSSICLFLLFKGMNICSCIINRWASAVFTTFLLHYIVLQYVREMRHTNISDTWTSLLTIYVAILIGGWIVHEPIRWLFKKATKTWK